MRRRILDYISNWEKMGYSLGIPDVAPLRLEQLCRVPSYHRICIAILKNDHSLQSIGFSPKRSRYYDDLKKIELTKRGVCIQLSLF